MTIKQNNQFTAVDFRYIQDDGLTGSAPRSNAFGTTGKLYGIIAYNTAASGDTGYLKLYDTNLAVTEGTTVPDFVFRIVAATTVAGRHILTFPEGLTFSSGFGYTLSANPGTTAGSAVAPAVEDLVFIFK
tara:strand:- start:78 stop:467 length:390 start_codon:yes stop_codon:yes gene_type:complete